MTDKKFDIEYPEGSGKTWTGAYAMTAAIKRALDDKIDILNPKFLSLLTDAQVAHIFRHVTTPIPMLIERTANLRNVGSMLLYESFKQLFESSGYRLINNGNGIIEKLLVFGSYYDCSFYRGRLIVFAKRAQLFPMMYHGRALSSNGVLKPIADPENFGPIADYEVPKILRLLGVLSYSDWLTSHIDKGIMISPNSDLEVEIRAQENNAMLKLLYRINEFRREAGRDPITIAELDYAIWSAGRAPEYKKIRHHYTYTTAY